MATSSPFTLPARLKWVVMPDEIEQRVESIEKAIVELDQTLGALIQAIPKLDSEDENQKHRKAISDQVWECAGCGARLGIYNSEKTELRVRYKDFLIYIIPGVGGRTSIPCRRCGHMNLIEDDRK